MTLRKFLTNLKAQLNIKQDVNNDPYRVVLSNFAHFDIQFKGVEIEIRKSYYIGVHTIEFLRRYNY